MYKKRKKVDLVSNRNQKHLTLLSQVYMYSLCCCCCRCLHWSYLIHFVTCLNDLILVSVKVKFCENHTYMVNSIGWHLKDGCFRGSPHQGLIFSRCLLFHFCLSAYCFIMQRCHYIRHVVKFLKNVFACVFYIILHCTFMWKKGKRMQVIIVKART